MKRTKSSWRAMMCRCHNPKSVNYGRYGAVGVSVCDQWREFDTFLRDMGPRPEGKTIDRYPDPFGNYEPTNCRWATNKEQMRNRRNNVTILYQGETKCVSAWAEDLGLQGRVSTIRSRLRNGWRPTKALELEKIPTGNEIVNFGGVEQTVNQWLANFNVRQKQAAKHWPSNVHIGHV